MAIHPGVYVNHTCEPSRHQREWAAVLYYWPAALTRESALPTPSTSGPVHVAVSDRRSLKRVPGVVTHARAGADLEAGACSVLERGYLELERRHGLPTVDRRQLPAQVAGKKAYRDVDHSDFGTLVELDGGAFHDNAAARDRDSTRDLAATVTSRLTTVRLTYGQVFRDGCATIAQIATLLERGGWPGAFTPCPECPGQTSA